MMKQTLSHLLIAVFLLLGTSHLSAQKLGLEWATPITGAGGTIIASAITLDTNENVFAVGAFTDSIRVNTKYGTMRLISRGATDMFVAKIDPAGAIEWIKAIGGKGALGNAGGNDINMTYWFDITSDNNGNLYISGTLRDTVDFDPGINEVLKTSRSYLSTGGSLGNPTVTKAFYENSFILKLNKDGNFVWVRTLYGNGNAAGGIAIDKKEGSVCITGYFKDTVDFNDQKGTDILTTFKGGQNTYVAKFDTSGNFIWARSMGRADKKMTYDQGIDIYIDGRGYIYTTGVHSDSADYDPGTGAAYLESASKPASNTFVLKLDAKGNYLWAGSIGSIQKSLSSRGSGITADSKGNVYTTGWFSRAGNFDPTGNPAHNVTGNNGSYGTMFLSKLDSNGHYVWVRLFDRPPSATQALQNGLSIQADKQDNVYFTGYFAGEIYFDPDPTHTSREIFKTNQGSSASDAFAVKLNEDGEFLWAKQFRTNKNPTGTSAGASVGKNIRISPNNNMYLAGCFIGITDFNGRDTPSVIINSTNPNARGEDGYIAKFSCNDTSIVHLTVEKCSDTYDFMGETLVESGDYTKTTTNYSGCDSTVYLHLILTPIPHPVINVNGFVLGTMPATYKTYQWLLNGSAIPGATGAQYTVTKNGEYQVVVSNEADCIDTSDIYTVTNAGIEDANTLAGAIKVYPNPATDKITIQSPVKVDVTLTDVTGRTVKQVANTQQVSLSSLAAGIYLLRLTDQEGTLIKVEKVVKQEK